MNHPHPREIMPNGDIVNSEGDVLHPDDYTDLESDEESRSTRATELGASSLRLVQVSEEDIGPSVDLKVYRESQLLARDFFAKAQRNEGLEMRLMNSGDTRDLTPIQEKRNEYMRVGTEHFKRAFGYEALKALAITKGEDLDEFEYQFKLTRNELIRSNRGRMGTEKRKKLRKIVDDTK